MNTETGELASEFVAEEKSGYRLHMPGGHGVIGLTYTQKLRKLGLPATGHELVWFFIENAAFSGLVTIPNPTIAAELGCSASRISDLKSRLEKAGLLLRLGPRTVFLNPAYFWRGKAYEQNKAVEKWCELNPVVPPSEEQNA